VPNTDLNFVKNLNMYKHLIKRHLEGVSRKSASE